MKCSANEMQLGRGQMSEMMPDQNDQATTTSSCFLADLDDRQSHKESYRSGGDQ